MNRRGFLRLLGLSAPLVLDPERLLWVPGQKTIFDLGGTRLHEIGWSEWVQSDIDLAENVFVLPAEIIREAARALAAEIDAEYLRHAYGTVSRPVRHLTDRVTLLGAG